MYYILFLILVVLAYAFHIDIFSMALIVFFGLMFIVSIIVNVGDKIEEHKENKLKK